MTCFSSKVAVLGAGLEGCGVALELARRGCNVTLIDQDARPMNRASRRNEGKIHLGLVYAMDASGATAALQLKGALSFRLLLERWLGDAANAVRRSTPFHYVVAPDSLRTTAELERHYLTLEARCAEILGANPGLDYLGERPERLAWRLPREAWRGRYREDRVAEVFDTVERAVDTEDLAERVAAAVAASPRIRFCGGRRVAQVERAGRGFRIAGGAEDGWSEHADRVVNATWEGRLAIDAKMGLQPAPGWLHRLKYRVIVRLDPAWVQAPSATMVVGRYGDVVVRPDATAYLSWYPAALRGWSEALQPPAAWAAACRGETPPDETAALAAEVKAALESWYPGVAGGETLTVDAGAIVAHGKTDVDDPGSGLHDRTNVGVTVRDGYVSVNAGKLTTAPLFAVAAADAVTGAAAEDLGAVAALLREAPAAERSVA